MGNRDVWVKATVTDWDQADRVTEVQIQAGHSLKAWVSDDDIRPRAEGAEPTGALRAACEMALKRLEHGHVVGLQETVDALRAALAEAPAVEGSVQEGDTVEWKHRGTVTRIVGDSAEVSMPTGASGILHVDNLTIIARAAPKPAHKCGQCRWLARVVGPWACRSPDSDRLSVVDDSPACAHFESWPSK